MFREKQIICNELLFKEKNKKKRGTFRKRFWKTRYLKWTWTILLFITSLFMLEFILRVLVWFLLYLKLSNWEKRFCNILIFHVRLESINNSLCHHNISFKKQVNIAKITQTICRIICYKSFITCMKREFKTQLPQEIRNKITWKARS